MSVKEYRRLSLLRLESISNYLGSLGNTYTDSDYQLDDFLRVWGKLPPRPDGRNPYEGLFELPAPATVINSDTKNPLAVPYFSQRDNQRDSWRTCFSSSCAMLLKFLIPDSISGDDEYINRVFSLGDTTRADVQVQALASYELKAVFRTDLNYSDLSNSLKAGVPVPIGFLHHGTDDAPSGGGHWAVVIGETPEDWIVNDPWGDLYSDYTNHNGKAVKYRKQSFDKRFMPDGKGWGIIAPPRPKPKPTTTAPSSRPNRISQRGLDLIKEFEGLRLDAYLCPAGVWTIGYGTTAGVKQGDRITKAQSEELLRRDVQQFENTVSGFVNVFLNQSQFDALVSFVYNIGAGAFAKSTLLRLLNQGDYQGASEQFARWNKGDGQVLEGLVRRREAERKLFLSVPF